MKNKTTSRKHWSVRQGDIFIERLDGPIDGVKYEDGNRVILAHGESSGHCHEIEDALKVNAKLGKPVSLISVTGDLDAILGSQSILTLGRDAKLVHQEHGTIELEAGTYRVTRQREYSPETIRNVTD